MAKAKFRKCRSNGCNYQVRVAIRSRYERQSGTTNRRLVHILYQDDRTAPNNAIGYCTKHATQLLTEIVSLADVDELMPDVDEICRTCGGQTMPGGDFGEYTCTVCGDEWTLSDAG